MSEGPKRKPRRQFTLGVLFVVVTEACMAAAFWRWVSPDERIGLLIVMAILGGGFCLVWLIAWLHSKLFRKI
jgi:uncharacterized membrane protein YfcA